MALPGRKRSLTIPLVVWIWIQYRTVTDGQTDTGRQQRPRLLPNCCVWRTAGLMSLDLWPLNSSRLTIRYGRLSSNVFVRRTSTVLIYYSSGWFAPGAVVTRTLSTRILISSCNRPWAFCLSEGRWFRAHHVNSLTDTIRLHSLNVRCDWRAQILCVLL